MQKGRQLKSVLLADRRRSLGSARIRQSINAEGGEYLDGVYGTLADDTVTRDAPGERSAAQVRLDASRSNACSRSSSGRDFWRARQMHFLRLHLAHRGARRSPPSSTRRSRRDV